MRDDLPEALPEPEERVHELALAAGELAHEGDREALVAQPALEVREPRAGLLVDEAPHERPPAEIGERADDGVLPAAQLLQAPLEGIGANVKGRAHRWHRGQKNVDR